MKILLIGKGAREHALAVKLAASPLTSELWLWPPHPQVVAQGIGRALEVSPDASMAAVATGASALSIDLVVCGPEAPLADGLADELAARRIAVFGPKRAGAALESSKAFAKDMMQKAGVPTAAFRLAQNEAECRSAALSMLRDSGGAVLKASGLAAGKGVFVCKTQADIEAGLNHLYHTEMRSAAAVVVVEELLLGRECSFFTFIGRGGATTLGFAVDFKRLQDGDMGPNTGGMGCYAPVPWLPEDAAQCVETRVVEPMLRRLTAEGIDYVGCLYVGLMWGEQGPRVVEFNVRLGDPEAQVLAVYDDRDWLALMAHKAGLEMPAEAVEAATRPITHGEKAVAVVMASPGYPFGKDGPGSVPFAPEIFANTATPPERAVAFAASVATRGDGIIPASGRVLTVAARGRDFVQARERAYTLVEEVKRTWPEAHYRRDIAMRAAKEEGSRLA